MAIDRSAVIDLLFKARSFGEIIEGIDEIEDVTIMRCKDCGAIFTSDLSDFDCYECASTNVVNTGDISIIPDCHSGGSKDE